MARVEVQDAKQIIKQFRKEILKPLRQEANRVRKAIRQVNRKHRRTGGLDRQIKVKTGWDAAGPYARITTSARNPTTRFRYGLAIQKREHYLQRGLDRTPRR